LEYRRSKMIPLSFELLNLRYNRVIDPERADWHFLFIATLIWVSALIVTAWDFIAVQGMNYRFGIVSAIGLSFGLTGVSIRRIAKRTPGKYYSYGLKTLRDHKTIKHGIYKYIRHPCYLAMILYSMGIPLFLSSLYGFLLILALLPCILYRIRIEEYMLTEKFGDKYRKYMTKTKKLFPFSLLNELFIIDARRNNVRRTFSGCSTGSGPSRTLRALEARIELFSSASREYVVPESHLGNMIPRGQIRASPSRKAMKCTTDRPRFFSTWSSGMSSEAPTYVNPPAATAIMRPLRAST